MTLQLILLFFLLKELLLLSEKNADKSVSNKQTLRPETLSYAIYKARRRFCSLTGILHLIGNEHSLEILNKNANENRLSCTHAVRRGN